MYEQGVFCCARRTAFIAFSAAILSFSASAADVTLGWDAPSDPSIVGYNIYYGAASREYTSTVPIDLVTNAVISGLIDGSSVYFAITAYDLTGLESDFSEEVYWGPPPNQPPTLDALSDVILTEGDGLQTVNLSGISSGATNESQTLIVTADSTNPSLIPNPTVTYASPDAVGSLTFTPASGIFGSATITVTVNDGQPQNGITARIFLVTVNNPITISAIPDQTIVANASTGPIPFTINDERTAAANLTLQAASSNPALVPVTNIVLGGADNNRTVTITPLPDQSGNADITIVVSDSQGTASTTFRLTVQPVAPKPGPDPTVTLLTNGNGTISPNLNAQTLKAGKTYTVTALPAKTDVFTGWSGSIISSTPKVSFVLTSNLVLTANFIPSPYIPRSGAYNGLFHETTQILQRSSGCLTVSANSRGAYSGRIQIGDVRLSFSGHLSLQCQATNVIPRNKDNALKIEFGLDGNSLSGQITDGIWTASLTGDRVAMNSRATPSPLAGAYTFILPGSDGSTPLPTGHSFGAVRVSTAGRLTFVGTLADGTKASQSIQLTQNGWWPLYLSLYSGDGSLIGWMAFQNITESDLNGSLFWTKLPGIKSHYYPGGFSENCRAAGSAYHAPVASTDHVLNFADADLIFSGGNLNSTYTNAVALGISSHVTNLSSNRLSLNFSLSTGTFRGSTTDPLLNVPLPFSGAVFQKQNAGFGLLLGTNQSSQVLLAP